MKKHVIWDFDGTLFDSYPTMAKAIVMILNEEGHEESYEDIYELLKVSMSHLIKYLEERYSSMDSFKERFKVKRWNLDEESLKPFEGIVEICKKVTDNGGMNHLYTHRGESSIEFLKRFGLLEHFAGLITSASGFPRKPDPRALNHLVEKYDIKHEEAIMIGDRDMDLLSAKNAGIDACFFTEYGRFKTDMDVHIVDKIEELEKLLF